MTSTDREHDQHGRLSDENDGPFDPSEAEESSDDLDAPDADPLTRALAERDEARAARQRALADFVNYQRRSIENEQRAVRDGTAVVVRSLLPALDNLDRALSLDPAKTTLDQLRDGVRIVRGEIARTLESHGVVPIAPTPGEEFDPRRHEALLRQVAEGVPADHVVALLQVGYAMGETVLRPAKVSLSQGH